MEPDGKRLRVVVADDEPLARQLLSDLLGRYDDIELVAQCESGPEAVAAVQHHRPDLLFLDIQMPELDGFGVLSRLPGEQLPAVVFVTAFDEFAVRAFDVNAVDYLLKPFDDERLETALARARARLRQPEDRSMQLIGVLETLRSRDYLQRIAVHDDERIFLVPVTRIDWIEAAGKQVRLHVAGDTRLARQGISSLEEALDPRIFVRVSRSAIVNLDSIREIQRWFQGQFLLILGNGDRVTTTRTYRTRLDHLLKSRS